MCYSHIHPVYQPRERLPGYRCHKGTVGHHSTVVSTVASWCVGTVTVQENDKQHNKNHNKNSRVPLDSVERMPAYANDTGPSRIVQTIQRSTSFSSRTYHRGALGSTPRRHPTGTGSHELEREGYGAVWFREDEHHSQLELQQQLQPPLSGAFQVSFGRATIVSPQSCGGVTSTHNSLSSQPRRQETKPSWIVLPFLEPHTQKCLFRGRIMFFWNSIFLSNVFWSHTRAATRTLYC